MVHRVIEAYDSWWSLLFEILCAWRRLMCAKQIISLVGTMKSVFFSRSVRPDDFRMTYRKIVHDFIPRFWSTLAYLGRLPRKSSDGRIP
ncbi:hypothetical protein IGI04_034246, partial [Brassica rapa subsp. trilocularis]